MKTYVDSDEQTFKGIFGHGEYLGPVKWSGSCGEAMFFIRELQQTELLPKTNRQSWQTFGYCFVKPDGSPLAKNFKEIFANIDSNVPQARQDRIQIIIQKNICP